MPFEGGAHRGQKKASDPMELELVPDTCEQSSMGAVNWTVLWKLSKCGSLQAVSPAPKSILDFYMSIMWGFFPVY